MGKVRTRRSDETCELEVWLVHTLKDHKVKYYGCYGSKNLALIAASDASSFAIQRQDDETGKYVEVTGSATRAMASPSKILFNWGFVTTFEQKLMSKTIKMGRLDGWVVYREYKDVFDFVAIYRTESDAIDRAKFLCKSTRHDGLVNIVLNGKHNRVVVRKISIEFDLENLL